MRRTVLAVALGALWVTTFGILDLVERDVAFFGSLSIAAIGVSLFASARAAFFVWAYAFGWVVALGVGPGDPRWGRLHLLRIAVNLLIGGSAVAIAYARERREHHLEVVSDVATAAQRALLRELPPRIDGAQTAARYISAAEDALVGGDFYEAMATPQGMRMIVGDVVGRGLDAVGLAGLVLGGFREAALSSADLAELARRLDATVQAFADGDEYATAVLAEFRGREVRLVSCGHPFPLLLDGAEPPTDLVLPTDLPLGYGVDPVVTPRTMRQGERLLFFTDGLSEARDGRGRFFDPTVDGASALAEHDPDAALDRLLAQLEAHTGGRFQDDVALVLVEPGER
jgi:sigma-B regulation protein RsbU (phosphoserine phosphatase)